uniref:RNase H type-1 domain-containing protein n=1 Tax=Arion vulgaris TaxID=1028688 RepID=A0A0B7BQG2_9EUPU
MHTTPLIPSLDPVPWEQVSDTAKIITISGITTGEIHNDLQKRTATMCMIQEKQLKQPWIHAYTDGSATNAIKKGGAGIFSTYPNNHNETRYIPMGKFCSNYTAEAQALL